MTGRVTEWLASPEGMRMTDELLAEGQHLAEAAIAQAFAEGRFCECYDDPCTCEGGKP